MSRPQTVALERATRALYADSRVADQTLRALAKRMGWGASDDAESPFSAIAPANGHVVVKPNWVLDENKAPYGLEPLVTHGSLIRAVVEALLRTNVATVTLGDAPLQECNFERLMELSGVGAWATELAARDPRFQGPRDYRRTKSREVSGVKVEQEGLVPLDRFVLFDLGGRSLLEPISGDGRFRVTMYPPNEMARTHSKGRHLYLVARDIIDADLVVNMPKLKTHKKAGVTCALKNLIGINGNKEFLPHHRLGGSESGGDCYPGADPFKRALEYVFDRANTTRSTAARQAWRVGKRALERVLHERGDEVGVEGAWSGNDTIWRTCLDLNRILLYGKTDQTLASAMQRRVVHVVDAVVAGQGDGPLAAEPLEMGLVLAADNAASMDFVGALLLGYDPALIPIVHHAFDRFEWPITSFDARDVRVEGALGEGPAEELVTIPETQQPIVYPIGWTPSVRNATAAAR